MVGNFWQKTNDSKVAARTCVFISHISTGMVSGQALKLVSSVHHNRQNGAHARRPLLLRRNRRRLLLVRLLLLRRCAQCARLPVQKRRGCAEEGCSREAEGGRCAAREEGGGSAGDQRERGGCGRHDLAGANGHAGIDEPGGGGGGREESAARQRAQARPHPTPDDQSDVSLGLSPPVSLPSCRETRPGLLRRLML